MGFWELNGYQNEGDPWTAAPLVMRLENRTRRHRRSGDVFDRRDRSCGDRSPRFAIVHRGHNPAVPAAARRPRPRRRHDDAGRRRRAQGRSKPCTSEFADPQKGNEIGKRGALPATMGVLDDNGRDVLRRVRERRAMPSWFGATFVRASSRSSSSDRDHRQTIGLGARAVASAAPAEQAGRVRGNPYTSTRVGELRYLGRRVRQEDRRPATPGLA